MPTTIVAQQAAYDPLDPLGVDLLFTGGDLDPAAQVVSGVDLVRQSLLQRLQTRPGSNPDDADYGYDLAAAMLNRALTPYQLATIPRLVEGECRKDERVGAVSCSISQPTGVIGAYTVTIVGKILGTGVTFDLVLSVADAAVKILAEG